MYESTKVKLLKFLEDVEDCSSTPVSISVNGEVNFENGGGDPVDPTQDCCSRYGYNWDEVNAICWAFTPTGDRPNSGVNGNATSPAPRVLKTARQTRSIVNSVINGESVSIEVGNKDMLAVGENLTLNKDVQGSTLLGKNVETNLPGIHVGGGYRDGDSSYNITGYAQNGIVTLHRYQAITASGQNLFLDIEGITANYLEIPNDTMWSCILNITIRDTSMSVKVSQQYSLQLSKTGGIAAFATPVQIASLGTFAGYTFTLDVDVASDTDQHRIFIDVAGSTFPINLIATASLQYQQSKTS
jgi:hypothetical protein